jgi:hypothetical protein
VGLGAGVLSAEGISAGSVYSLLAGVSGAIIVVIVALGIAIARTREQLSKVLEWQRLHDAQHQRESK